jgi:hypothetical protein
MMSEFANFIDPFVIGGTTGTPVFVFRIGEIDVTPAVKSRQLTTGQNKMPECVLLISSLDPSVPYIDWRARVNIISKSDKETKPIFGGDVVSVTVKGEYYEVHCVSLASVNETILSGYTHQPGRFIGADLIFATMREGGMRADEMKIGDEQPPLELFQVIVPLYGVVVQNRPFRIGGVLFTAAADIKRMPELLLGHTIVTRDFSRATLFAVVYAYSHRMYDAEQTAISRIDESLSWLVVRSQYSLAVLPDGSNSSWLRQSSLSNVRRGNHAFVRGFFTNRTWLRDLTTKKNAPELRLDRNELKLGEPVLAESTAEGLRNALKSCARSVREIDYSNKITAIWDTVEFYAGQTAVEKIFTKGDLKSIRRSLPSDLGTDKRSRLDDLIGTLNKPPLLTRFRKQIAVDGVPLTDAEFDQFAQLRKVRNELVHGRSDQGQIDREDVDRCVALLARILVHAAASAGGDMEMV